MLTLKSQLKIPIIDLHANDTNVRYHYEIHLEIVMPWRELITREKCRCKSQHLDFP